MAKIRQRQEDQFGIAEAMGEIVTMPEINEAVVGIKEPQEEIIIDNPEDFRMAIGQAQMDGEDSIEVGEKLFKYLLKNSKSPYLTYGDPGIKVFLKGTRDKIEKEEKMTAEAYLDMLGKKAKDAQANV